MRIRISGNFSIKALCLSFLISSVIFAQRYQTYFYTESSGLPSSYINTIINDESGKIWIGTKNGLANYNGFSFKIFKDPSISRTNIHQLISYKDGSIWALSNETELKISIINEDSLLKTYRFKEPKAFYDRSIFDILIQGTDTTIAVLSNFDDLAVYSNGKWNAYKGIGITGINRIYDLKCIDNKFYLGTNKGVYSTGDFKVYEKVYFRDELNSMEIYSFNKSKNSIWIMGKDFIGVIKDNKFHYKYRGLLFPNNPNSRRYKLIPDYYGKIIVTNEHLTYLINPDNNSANILSDETGLFSSGAFDVLLDKEFVLWFASARGISKVPSMRFQIYNKENGLFRSEVTSIVQRDKDDFVIGHFGGLSIIKNGKLKRISFTGNKDNSYYETSVLDMDIDREGNVWLTSKLHGLGRLDKQDKLEWVIPDQGVNSLKILNDQVYLLADFELLSFDIEKMKETTVTVLRVNSYLRKIFYSPDEKLYITTDRMGIVVVENNKIKKIIRGNSPNADNVFAVYFKGEETLVGSMGGLYKIVNDSLVRYDKNKISIDRPIYAIAGDKTNNLWFGTDNGLIKWDGKTQRFYTTEYGLPGLEINRDALMLGSDGTMWIGTSKGLGIYQKEFDNSAKIIPAVQFEKINAGGKSYDLSQNIKPETSENTIEFFFDSFSYISENNNSFSVLLEGFEDKWVDIGHQRQVRYTNLPAGVYKLNVKSRNALDNWSRIYKSNSVTISSPFYQRWWFTFIIIIVLISLIYLIYSYYIKTNYAAKLESEVNKRTAELKNSENRYSTLFMENLTPMLLVDPNSGAIIEGNNASIKFYGYEYDDLCKINFTELTMGDREFKFNEYANSGKTVRKTKQKLKNGEIRDVEIFISPVRINEDDYNYFIINDITDTIVTKKALMETEEKYKSLLENMQDGVFVIQDGILQYTNPALQTMINYSGDQLKGEEFTKFIAPEDREYVKSLHMQRISGNTVPAEYEIKLLKNDGVTRVQANIHVGTLHFNGRLAVLGTLKNITERIQKEDQLKKLSLAIEQSPVAVLITDLKGDIEYVNPKFSEISGYTSEEMIGKNPKKLKFNTDNNRLYPDMWEHIANGEIWRGEFHNKTKDGKSFWVSAVISPVADIYGNVTHYLAVEEDITIQKLISEALRKNEELLKSVLNFVPVTIFALNHKKEFALIKGNVNEFLGVNESEILHKNYENVFANHPLIKADISIAIQEKSFRKVRKINKKIFEITYVPFKEFESDLVGITGIVYDITERYNSEIAVKESEAKNKAILNALPDLMFEFSKDGIITNCHSVEESQILLSKNLYIGKFIGEMVDVDTAQKIADAIKQAGDKGDVVKFEYSTTFPDGILRHFDARLVRSDASTYIAIVRDITERIDYEKQLIESRNQAEKSDRLKTEFLAQMSHEIRTPINSILSFSALLKEELVSKLPEELKDAFTIIEDGGRRLIRTIDLILNMAQLQTGNFEPNIKKINIDKDVLSSVITELKNTARKKGLLLNYNINTDNLYINGDDYTLGQIFMNLIENAIKYTHTGKVEVNVRDNSNGKIFVDIVDTGIGISSEYLPHLFDEFTQEYSGYTRSYEGNGLGLALVKKYVEINNAEISVASRKDEGSTFTVKFKSV